MLQLVLPAASHNGSSAALKPYATDSPLFRVVTPLVTFSARHQLPVLSLFRLPKTPRIARNNS